MANHRMFTTEITMSDAFLDMPKSSQCLYFHLNLNADDDGFVGNPKTIMRIVGSAEDDMKLLITKNFVIPFDEKGIIVIKHWRMHNLIRKDRKKDTPYQEELSLLTVKENGSYTKADNQLTTKRQPIDNQVTTNCQPSDNQMSAQDKISKDKISKDKIGDKKPKGFTPPTLEEVKAYCEEKGLTIEPKAFLDYFTESGWIDSKGNKVRNWKQKLLTWQKYEPKQEVRENNWIKEPAPKEQTYEQLFGKR